MPIPVVKSAHTESAVTITTTTETVLLTLAGVSTRDASELVQLIAHAAVTLGTGTTSYVVRLRRGVDITGTLIGNADTYQGTAGNTVLVAIQRVDAPGAVAGQSYVVTLQQTAATANGSSLDSEITAVIGG